MNSRRKLVLSLSATLFVPRTLFAQAKKDPVLIGWLHTDSLELSTEYLDAFKEGLAALGLKDGVQLRIDERWASRNECEFN